MNRKKKEVDMEIEIKGAGDILLPYTEHGAGEVMVLLHGFMESGAIWDDYATVLSEYHRVIVPDLPGHGSAPLPGDGVVDMETIAAAVYRLLTHLGVTCCTLVGHSMGGYVALEFAAMYPGMVNRLVLFHSQAGADSPEAQENRDRAIRAVRQNHKGFVAQFIPDLFAPDNREPLAAEIRKLQEQAGSITAETIVAAMEGMKNRKCHYETLKNINVPVLFIVGQLDTRIDMAKVMEQMLLPAECTVLVLRDCGHMGYLEARDECLRAIRRVML
jgi:pimeloyl-ACP methyl ester carboxylesterase